MIYYAAVLKKRLLPIYFAVWQMKGVCMAGKENGEKQEEFSFVTEQIKPSRGRVKRHVLKFVEAVLLAVVFGLVAGVTFAFVLSYVQPNMDTNEGKREPVTIPRDEQPDVPDKTTPEETKSEMISESETISETESDSGQEGITDNTEDGTELIETTRPLAEIVEDVLKERGLTIEDYSALYGALYEVVTAVNQSIVTVTSSQNGVDWFNNTYESSEETSGLIYNKTEKELLIMTNAESIHNADDISVTFSDGTEYDATLCRMDYVTGLAVLSVDVSSWEEEYLTGIRIAALGNSYTVKQGDPVIAVGNPMGYNYSMSYGVVTNTRNTTQTVDANLRLINTTALSDSSGNGFLLNLKGEVVGIITREYKSESSSNIITAIAVSDIKGILELLSNKQSMPYFGIIGQEVTADIAENMGLPIGVYVAEAEAGSPAYQAGIQGGDIIVSINDMDMKTMKVLRNSLENCYIGESITVTILRAGREEYREIEVEVILTEREIDLE